MILELCLQASEPYFKLPTEHPDLVAPKVPRAQYDKKQTRHLFPKGHLRKYSAHMSTSRIPALPWTAPPPVSPRARIWLSSHVRHPLWLLSTSIKSPVCSFSLLTLKPISISSFLFLLPLHAVPERPLPRILRTFFFLFQIDLLGYTWLTKKIHLLKYTSQWFLA